MARFKSYYVVWKPDFVFLNFKKITKFKSYYVVWKHPTKTNSICAFFV